MSKRYYSHWFSNGYIGQKYGNLVVKEHCRDNLGYAFTVFECSDCGREYTTYWPQNVYNGKKKCCQCKNMHKKYRWVCKDVDELPFETDYADTELSGSSYVYVWRNSDNVPFYVGKGTYGRFKALVNRSEEFLNKYNEDCNCVLIAKNMNDKAALKLESDTIAEYYRRGYPLVNVTGIPR